ncbi:MAG: M48 family metallopeptidase [Pyrinomonadaceae bacterium]
MQLEYEVIYSDRKKIQIAVERDKSIVVRVPEGTSSEAIESAIKKKKLWIYKKTKHPQKYHSPKEVRNYISGTSILYLGKEHKLDVVDEDFDGVRFDGRFLISDNSALFVEQFLQEWFIEEAKKIISPKVEEYAGKLGVTFNKILVSKLKYRWGSCTPKDNLNFNWRLVKAPVSVIDYVIVHELAHLLEANHTQRFWTIISVQLPHYQKAKDWLKENGNLLEIL